MSAILAESTPVRIAKPHQTMTITLIKSTAFALLSLAVIPAFAQEEPAPEAAAQSLSQPDTAPEAAIDSSETPAPDSIAVEAINAENGNPIPPDPQPEEATRLDEVMVTATKRATSVRDIPATLTVLSGEDLEREGIQSMEQIVSLVPGVNLNDGGQGEAKRLTIRGISTDVNANFTAGTLFGDIPFSDPFVPKVQLDPNPFDMATVEILKGPQGTLFGGTGLNGMIRYVPEAPQFDGVHIKYFTQFTAYPGNGDSGWSYGAVVNTPFADDTAALRLMGFYREAPGFVDDTQAGKSDVNQAEQYGFRAMLAWHPAEEWTLSLLGLSQYFKQDDVAFTSNFDGELERSNTNRPSPIESRYNLVSLGVERTFEWGDVVSQTSMVEKEFDAFLDASRAALGGQFPVLVAVGSNQSEAFTQEFRVVSPANGSPWKWLGGAFYNDSKLYDCAEAAVGGFSLIPGLPLPPILQGVVATPCPGNAEKLAGTLDVGQLIGDLDLTEHALFGELTRALGEDWEATLGARVYRTRSDGSVSRQGALYSAVNLGQPAVRNAAVEERGVSPKASIVFHPTQDLNAYVTVSRGFRFGGPQIAASTLTTSVPEIYKSDSLWNYELGVRSDWFEQALRLDASVYLIDWTDPQVRQVSNDGLVQFIDNVGGVEGRGADLSLRFVPPFVEGVTLNVSAAWNRTVTTEDFDSASGARVSAGSPWPLAPRWQTSTTVAYMLPLDTWRTNVSLRHTYTGTACNDIECGGKVFGYRTLDLNLSAAALEHPMWPELSLSLANLTDERGINALSINPTLGNAINYIAPRSIVVRLSGTF